MFPVGRLESMVERLGSVGPQGSPMGMYNLGHVLSSKLLASISLLFFSDVSGSMEA